MEPHEAVTKVMLGQLVDCTKEEYPIIRYTLQQHAGRWIDQGQNVYAQIALSEVRRLDHLHKFELK
jgi:hypothetical protein